MSLAFFDPELEEGYKRYHAEQNTGGDYKFCGMGTCIWTLTFFRIPAAASWHHRALVVAAVVSTLMPWILGLQRWTQHREPLVFTLRFLRTAALQAQVNPQSGAAVGPPAGLLNAILVSKCVQLLMFRSSSDRSGNILLERYRRATILVQLRFRNHMCLQAVSLAIGWQLNQRTCKGWQRHIQRQLAACSQDIRPDGLEGPQLRDSLFSGFVRGCNKYMGTQFHLSHGCPLTLGGLQLLIGFVAPSLWVLQQERRSRREYATLCGAGADAAEGHAVGGHRRRQAAFGLMAALVGASLCWQLLEAYERFL